MADQMLDKWDKLQDIIKWAKAEKIASLKLGDLEVTFHPAAFIKAESPKPETTLSRKIKQENERREAENNLFWSS